MRKETDTGIVFCPVDQIAFDEELMKGLVNMAVDLRDTANETLLGTTGA